MLSFATEEIAHRLGDTLGGLVNATFGNAVELIVRHTFLSPISGLYDTLMMLVTNPVAVGQYRCA